MSTRETIPTRLTPPLKPTRPHPAEKAQELLQAPQVKQRPVLPRVVKITTKILADQVEWLKEEADRYGIDHPRAPRLTMEELVQIALDELRKADDLDDVVRRYRS